MTVIKPLKGVFKKVKWISGFTIPGNGEVALILDVLKFLSHAERGKSILKVAPTPT